ncbi:hypothetical protein LLG96_13660 [bacterium]|nr:hypothetical protein [bacterium]
MADKILIAYASKYGSTAEVAAVIGEVLSQAGADVDIVPARKVRDIGPYGYVILGTPIFMGKPQRASIAFARKHRTALGKIPVALFSLGLQMMDDTPENREKARQFLAPLLAIIGEPVSLGLFGARIDHSKFGFILRFIASRDKSGVMRGGDWRNWDNIREWAAGLTALLSGR